jgi:hypothetical protein
VLDHAVHTLEVVLVVSVHVDYCHVQRKARAEIFLEMDNKEGEVLPVSHFKDRSERNVLNNGLFSQTAQMEPTSTIDV